MNSRNEVTFAEMFCGVGGFRFGLEKANQIGDSSRQRQRMGSDGGKRESCLEGGSVESHAFTCVWANDIDKYACQIYRKHYGDKELVEADIKTVDPDGLPDFELLTAGFPCQSFSLAGKRKGFEDTRGTLFYEVARVASAKRPKLLLLENVKGLLSNDEGRTFAKILQTLDELGYDVEWQVLNSKHFGVPQNRERVFIIGHLRGTGSRQIFPIGKVSELSSREAKGQPESWEASTLEATYGKTKNLSNMVYHQNKSGNVAFHDEVQALRSSASHSYQGVVESALIQSRGLETRKDGLSHCVKGGGGGTSKNHIQIFDGHHRQFTEKMGTLTGRENRQGTNWLVVADRSRSYADKGRNLESPKPITNALSGVQKDNLVIANAVDCDGYLRSGQRPRDENGKPQLLPIGYRRIRRLTPVECERLQGFPDGWTEGVSDTQRYKLLGNAVTTTVIEFLGMKLLEAEL